MNTDNLSLLMHERFDAAAQADITPLTEKTEDALGEAMCPMKAMMQISIAIDEIYSNIVKYGYREMSGPVDVSLYEQREPHAFVMSFSDEAPAFDPLSNKDPDITLSAEERGIGGLGLFIVKKSMDRVEYRYENGKNVLTITKNV